MQVREIARLSTPLVVLSTPLVVLSTPLAVRGPRPMKVRQIAQVPISQVGRGSWERNCLRHAFHRICGRADLSGVSGQKCQTPCVPSDTSYALHNQHSTSDALHTASIRRQTC